MANTSGSKKKNAKVSAAREMGLKTLKQVFDGQSLSAVQIHTTDRLEDSRDRGLANELVNGVLRWRWQLEFFISQLVKKPLKQKDIDVQLVLLMAIYELNECRTPDYAVINESVELVRKSGKKWAAGLVNAVLRSFTRKKEQLVLSLTGDQAVYSHPTWLLEKIKTDWPEPGGSDSGSDSGSNYGWQEILNANNQRPAFWLRVNSQQGSVTQYLKKLEENGLQAETSGLSADALMLLHGVDVRTLPGFDDGAISVQDAGAQLSAQLLNVSENQRVLDLCAAPGGKTCHILEFCHTIKSMTAVEVDESRMQRVEENIKRLKLSDKSTIELVVADAIDNKAWWSGEAFDRILIDAPCSASGVIRRHPDIKTHRRESDIAQLVQIQGQILEAAWQMLAKGGELLYVTCSVFKDENQNQVKKFMSEQNDAAEIVINAQWGTACEYGRQLFPGEQGADGFYFCRLKKIL